MEPAANGLMYDAFPDNYGCSGVNSRAPTCAAAPQAGCARASAGGLRLLREAEHALTDDVALDLGGAAPDGLGAGEEEARLQRAHRVALAPAPRPDAGEELLVGRLIAREDLAVHPEDVERQLHRVAVVLGPVHLVGGAEGHRGVVAGEGRGERAQAVDLHDLHLRPGLGEALADERVDRKSVV